MKKVYVYNNNFINIRLYRFKGDFLKTYDHCFSSHVRLIKEGEEVCQLHKEKSELEEKLRRKLKRKQVHIEQLRDHNHRLNSACEKRLDTPLKRHLL